MVVRFHRWFAVYFNYNYGFGFGDGKFHRVPVLSLGFVTLYLGRNARPLFRDTEVV